VTLKSHGLWFKVPQQLTYLGRLDHFMEDPIEKLHKIDRLMDAVYSHLRDYDFREESKMKQEAIGKNYAVREQMEQASPQSHKRKLAAKTLLMREEKNVVLTIIKKERRFLLL
jgi:hypothetical protein